MGMDSRPLLYTFIRIYPLFIVWKEITEEALAQMGRKKPDWHRDID